MKSRRSPLLVRRRGKRVNRLRRKVGLRSRKQGSMFLLRKIQPLHTSYDSASVNGYVVREATQNSLTLGTPVAVLGVANCYDIPFTLQFRFDEVVNYNELAGLFDRYKILGANIKVQTTLNTGSQTQTPVPFIDYIVDHDDASIMVPTAFREKMGTKTKYFSSTRPVIGMAVKPVPASLLYNGITSGYGVPKSAPYINMTNTGVPHYGIKGILRNVFYTTTQSASPLTWDITYALSLKDIQ